MWFQLAAMNCALLEVAFDSEWGKANDRRSSLEKETLSLEMLQQKLV